MNAAGTSVVTAVALALGVAALGGLGAVARYLLDAAIRRRSSGRYPWGTMIINLSGSLLLGLLAGLLAAGRLPGAALVVLGSGLLGGYTTFSSASQETLELMEDRRPLAALAHGGGMLVGAVAAAALGLAVGGAL